jgi:hypothetical protein
MDKYCKTITNETKYYIELSDDELHQICKQKDINYLKSFFTIFLTLLIKYDKYLASEIEISKSLIIIDKTFIEYIGCDEYYENADENERIVMHKIIFYLFCLQMYNILYSLCQKTSPYAKFINILSKKFETAQKLLNHQNGGNLYCYKFYKANYVAKNKYRDKLLYKMNKYIYLGLNHLFI